MSHILIVDDEPSICWGFRELLTDEGHRVSIASSAEEAVEAAAKSVPDAVMLDVRLPGNDGVSTIPELRRHIGDAPIIVMTAFGNLDIAVRALAAGAYDYLPKPFDLEQATEILGRALRRGEKPTKIGEAGETGETIIGSSLPMQAVFKQIALVAPSHVPVLITGESGTGKELVAQAIHRHSSRRDAPLIPISLAALSPTLIERELFGHVRGAFTGAERDRPGLLELADGGTVLLDEIGDVPPAVQVKLLRAIEGHEVTPVGDARPRHSDFRVIAATNRSLAELVAKGQFRQDLFYRLSVFHIELPPLRDRVEDIPLLVEHFLQSAGGRPRRLSDAAIRELSGRRWAGNVRELRNAIEHATVLARGDEIEAEHLPSPSAAAAESNDEPVERQLQRLTEQWVAEVWSQAEEAERTELWERFMRAVEPTLLRGVVARCDGNRAAAARLLGIHRATLRQKLNEAE